MARLAANGRSKSPGQTKERIIKVAAEMFARKGYHATGVEELSTEVGLGRGALYYHITSKEDLLHEILSRPAEEMSAAVLALQKLDLPSEAKLRQFAQTLMRGISDNRAEWTVFFREFHGLTDHRLRAILELRNSFELALLGIINQGITRGDFRNSDPELLVKGILGMFNYSYLWIRADGRCTPEEIADLFCDALLRGIRAN
jgi:AcrR family transcriptional regulator